MKQFWKWTTIVAALASLAFAQKPKGPKETEAIMAVQNASDPDSRLAAIDSLLTRFPDTEFKMAMHEIAIDTARQKGDMDLMTIWCERTLDAAPNDLDAISSLAKVVGATIRENDLDKEDKLKKVDGLVQKCFKLLPDAQKPYASMPDNVFTARKAEFTSDCHEAAAATAKVRGKFDEAVTEYQASLAARKDPATMVRIGQVYVLAGKYDEAIAILDQAQAFPDVNPVVKQVAAQEKVKAIMAKNKTPKPAPAPPKPQE
ncbi:MAG TPA: tetratricopeptide repeat protein [Bryobacteraceae bacterium]|jgi:tetratricopeptide (TPR) repeat protein